MTNRYLRAWNRILIGKLSGELFKEIVIRLEVFSENL